MKERFSKARMIKVLETQCAQCVQCYGWVTGGEELLSTTTAEKAEGFGPGAAQFHARYNAYKGMIYFIKMWDQQSEEFLHPEKVGKEDD
jgi:hypothetical protein